MALTVLARGTGTPSTVSGRGGSAVRPETPTAQPSRFVTPLADPDAGIPAEAAGTIGLAGAADGAASLVVGGVITLGGTIAPPTAVTTAGGTITLGGEATPTPFADGLITLSGSAAGAASVTAAGVITLTGAVTSTEASSADGTITLTGATTATPLVTPEVANLTLSGDATGVAAHEAHATLTLTGRAWPPVVWRFTAPNWTRGRNQEVGQAILINGETVTVKKFPLPWDLTDADHAFLGGYDHHIDDFEVARTLIDAGYDLVPA